MYTSFKFLIVTTLAVLTLGIGVAYAEQSSGLGSQSVQLNFAVNIPQVLFLRVGSAGATIDTVTFTVTDIPEVQPTVVGDVTPILRVGAMTPSTQGLALSADSSTAMTNGSDTMPFSVISFSASAPFNVSSTAYNSTAAQSVWTGTGPGFRDGTMSFVYTNSYTYGGNFTGTVTYTLSAP